MKNFRKSFCYQLIFLLGMLTPVQAQEVNDPFESVNRGVFWFNEQVDDYFLAPVARAYKFVLPKFARSGISNFFDNLRYPSLLVSDVVQGKFDQAGLHTVRFLFNSTVGIAGLIDVAEYNGLEDHHEDFGTALGYYGISEGPYLVLPLLGPSNIRDGVGRIVDTFLNPLYWVFAAADEDAVRYGVAGGVRLLEAVDDRSEILEAVDTGKEATLDYYSFVQSSYHQIRQNQIYDGEPPDEFEDEFGDEE